jgi:hypothetical protein
MKLLDHPGLFGLWPPPAHDDAGKTVQLEHCLDVLVFATCPPIKGANPIRILTAFERLVYIRQIVGKEEIFARVFCEFLNEQQGKTIREIGEIDVTLLGLDLDDREYSL